MIYNRIMELAGDLIGAGAGLVAVFERLLPLMRQISTAGDLSMPAASVLARLVRDGPQRLTELATQQAVSQPAMTQLVSRLERDGLAARSSGSGDRRVVLVAVTEAGRKLAELRRGQRARVLGDLLDRMAPADQDAIRAALPALTRLASLAPAGLSQAAADPTPVAVPVGGGGSLGRRTATRRP
jgi:DNA-binding MarR family transcriptional regulator